MRGLAESSAGRRGGAAEMLNGSGTQNDCGVNAFIKRAENRQGRASAPRRRRDVHYVSQRLALEVGGRRSRRNKRRKGRKNEGEVVEKGLFCLLLPGGKCLAFNK